MGIQVDRANGRSVSPAQLPGDMERVASEELRGLGMTSVSFGRQEL